MSVADVLRHATGPVSLRARWVLPIDMPPIEYGEVLIDEGRIVSVGKAGAGESSFDFGLSAILPGFVGTHFRLEETVLRGLLHQTESDQRNRLHSTLLSCLTLEERTVSATLGAAELLATGMTSLGDISPSGASLTALLASGQRGIVYRAMSGDIPTGTALPILRGRITDMQGQIARNGADERMQAGCAISHEGATAFQTWANEKNIPACTASNHLFFADPFTQMHSLMSKSARATLRAVTTEAAQALGLDEIGSLSRGKRADLCIVRLDGLHVFPTSDDDPETALAQFSRASDVAVTIADGRVLYESGRWTLVDVPRLRLATGETRAKLRRERDKAVGTR